MCRLQPVLSLRHAQWFFMGAIAAAYVRVPIYNHMHIVGAQICSSTDRQGLACKGWTLQMVLCAARTTLFGALTRKKSRACAEDSGIQYYMMLIILLTFSYTHLQQRSVPAYACP